ncbi:hypothetical protein [Limnobacter parvus]|uniref:Uncharacterized protein n=1 Tax=Limnobacter parvus TaxID=2939690 RepID=A0ABT1XKW5_9BURK|nr:hypothetical protein [Limnobacter parvus]MCR2747938.1 hypothetical protein [Limnobacter parvus]
MQIPGQIWVQINIVEALNADAVRSGSSLMHMLEQIQQKRQAIQLQIETAQAQLKLLNQFEDELRRSPESIKCEFPVDPSPRGRL